MGPLPRHKLASSIVAASCEFHFLFRCVAFTTLAASFGWRTWPASLTPIAAAGWQDCCVGLLFALLPILGGDGNIARGVISMSRE
jgi:hypothetical protein